MAGRPFHLPAAAGAGQRFCLAHEPAGGAGHAAILYLHPFAEEANKSRRMAALQCHAFASHGAAVLQLDAYGCGDSSGDFGDATWQHWIDDVDLGARWLRRHSEAPLWLWGLRGGCLLAADAARTLRLPCHFLFWQPLTSGSMQLHQFLRLAFAADLIAGESRRGSQLLKQRLDAGEAVDVAGYRVAPALARPLARCMLDPPADVEGRRLEWIEVSQRHDGTLLPASAAALQRWQDAGVAARARAVGGPAFWQTVEIETAPSLIDASLAAVFGA